LQVASVPLWTIKVHVEVERCVGGRYVPPKAEDASALASLQVNYFFDEDLYIYDRLWKIYWVWIEFVFAFALELETNTIYY
jgi:hypothetical protein